MNISEEINKGRALSFILRKIYESEKPTDVKNFREWLAKNKLIDENYVGL